MKRHTVRRVPVGGAFHDDWIKLTASSGTIRLNTAVGRWAVTHTDLVRWGGLASIVGGGLWVVLFLLLRWQFASDTSPDSFSDGFRFIGPSTYARVLAVPMLLFMFGLGATNLRLAAVPNHIGMRRAGMLLSTLGLLWATIFPIGWIPSAGLVGTPPLLGWYHTAEFGLFVLAVGLLLAGIASRTMKTWLTGPLLLVAASSAGAIVATMIWLVVGTEIDFEYFYDMPRSAPDIFTAIAVLFGIGWIWLGLAMWTGKVRTS